MTNLLATAAFVLLFAGTTTMAQQKPAKRTTTKKSLGKTTTNEIMRSNPSAADTHDGTAGVSVGVGAEPAGANLTNDQVQGARSGSVRRTTSVDAHSSVRTGTSGVKAKKKAPKDNKH